MIQKKKLAWQHVLLAALLVASLLLHFWSLEKEGYSNPYYAAAVQGMLDNPSAFFYGSFDSGLYVTVDKPAFGLWLQALSAGVFGVNSFGLILPSALAGTLCVLLMFFIIRKKWGDTAGVIAAGIMAFTPILVALSRTNNLDVLLLFFLLCGTLLMQNAVEKQSLPLYLAAMACVGIGFNIKMLQAFLVVPAFLLWYLLGSGKWLKKILHTVLALVVLFVVSFSWALAVDLTPASERPYVGGSDNNSVIELALGYNGLNRLLGPQRDRNAQAQDDDGQPPAMLAPDRPALSGDATRPPRQQPNDPQASAIIARRSGGGVGGSSENGEKGVFRLFDEQLGGLASWFLLPALAMAALGGAGALQWLKKRKSAEWTQEKTEALRQTLFLGRVVGSDGGVLLRCGIHAPLLCGHDRPRRRRAERNLRRSRMEERTQPPARAPCRPADDRGTVCLRTALQLELADIPDAGRSHHCGAAVPDRQEDHRRRPAGARSVHSARRLVDHTGDRQHELAYSGRGTRRADRRRGAQGFRRE